MAAESERTYLVDGMSCGHCRAAITSEVAKVVGVADVAVDLSRGTVTVGGSNVVDAGVRNGDRGGRL